MRLSLLPPEEEFEKHRTLLEGLAYRMCGVWAEAQDIVQETHLRWCAAAQEQISNPRAWLVTVCSRLAMDYLASARVRREQYVGVWLPEPYVPEGTGIRSPEAQLQMDESVSVALMLALERLSPAERAAFLLHDVFGYSFEEVETILNKSAVACRQLAVRARKTVREKRPRFPASPEVHRQLLEAFMMAVREGDAEQLKRLLAESVEFYADGGGRVKTAGAVLRGAEELAAFFLRIRRENALAQSQLRFELCWFNGQPGLLVYQNGDLQVALSAVVEGERIQQLFAWRNPEKLRSFLPSRR